MSGSIVVRSKRFVEEYVQTNTWDSDKYEATWSSEPNVVRIVEKSTGTVIAMINGRDVLTVELGRS